MSSTELELPFAERRAASVVLRRAISFANRRKFPHPLLFLLVAVWLCRNFLFSSSIPAGTDMLGFVTRARQNASLSELVSAWSPSSLGAIRQVTMDNLLGAVTLATGNAFLTVKLIVVATLFIAAYGAYSLSHEWYWNRRAATIAGLLYMTSQASLTRWGSGEVNVEVVVAAAPFVLLFWGRCLNRATRRRVISLALAMNVVLFIRIDMLLYLLPFMALQLAVTMATSAGALRALLRAAAVSLGAALCTLGLTAYQLVPIMHGLKAHWLTTTTLFDPTEFAQRSIALFPSLLGFGREIGYFAFSGEETWLSHPWVPTPIYEMTAGLLVVVAAAAVVWHRGGKTLFLAASMVLGIFLAKGIREPLASPYLLAVRHVPAFGNLRDPNRWLIVSSLAVSILAGLSAVRVCRIVQERLPRPARWAGVASVATAGLVVAILPVGPTLVRGFLTWRPTPDQRQLFQRVERDTSSFTVATIPYDQNYRFLEQAGYRGYEHDLGAESATFTGHPVLADGGWNQHAADFVAYTSGLLDKGDDAFPRLLGTVGIKYLVRFAYPETAPHLLPPAILAKQHDPSTGSFAQQRGSLRFESVTPIARNPGGTVLRLPGWSPPVSFRANRAVVLDGRAGLAAFADLRNVHLDRWDVATADDLLGTRGLTGLLRSIRSADAIVLGNDSVESISALASPALAVQPGMTNTPALDRLTELLPSDASIRQGSPGSAAVAPATPNLTRVASTFFVRTREPLEIWAHVQASPTAAHLEFLLDGRVVGRLTPLALNGAMVWLRARSLVVGPGRHTLATTVIPSVFGDDYEVDETRVTPARARVRTEDSISRALRAQKQRVTVAIDLDSVPLGIDKPSLYRSAAILGTRTTRFWSPVGVSAGGKKELSLQLAQPRQLYTVAQHAFSRPVDLSGRNFVFVTYGASPSVGGVRFILDFNRRHRGSVSFSLPSGRATRTIALTLAQAQPHATRDQLRHVVSVRVATDSRTSDGLVTLGNVGISASTDRVALTYPLPCGVGTVEPLAPDDVRAQIRSCVLSATVPRDAIGRHERIVAEGRVAEHAGAPVLFVQTSATSYTWSVNAPEDGTLVLNEGFDPHWTLISGGTHEHSTPAFSVTNSFPLSSGPHNGTISLAGSSSVAQGIGLSGAVLAGLLLVGFGPTPRPRRRKRRSPARKPEARAYPIHRRSPGFWALMGAAVTIGLLLPASLALGVGAAAALLARYRFAWWHLAGAAGAIVLAAPMLAEVSDAAADTAALEALMLFALALVMLGAAQRRRYRR